MKKKWYDYLWAAELLYWTLGLCNILFAWLGMFFFVIPLMGTAGKEDVCDPGRKPSHPP